MRARSRNWNQSRNLRLEHLEVRSLLAADVYISEFVASSDTTFVDEDGDFPDWVEVYNAGPDDVNLDSWNLTDDPGELRKWQFPAQDLSAGNFVVVYLSDKDRAVEGEPLHANFKLQSAGEYLALTQDTGPATVDIISEFDPDYPQQLTDISYGYGQSVAINEVSSATDSAKFFVPKNNALGTQWTQPNFDDGSWQDGTAALGYQRTVPGFAVQDAKSNSNIVNLSEAVSVLNGIGQTSQSVAITTVVDFVDQQGGGGTGNFGNDLDFPNDSPQDDNDFAIRATGTITIPTAGTWSFGINSDDGARLTVGGQEVINDDTLHSPRNTIRRSVLTAGKHDIELIFFERGGGAEVELWAAEGRHTTFNSSFKLIGDVANGGLAVETSPTGDTTTFGRLYETNVEQAMFGESSSIYVRVPVMIEDPTSLDSLTMRVNYDDAFVAYLNGQEVARQNVAAGEVPPNATAQQDRARLNAEFTESVDLTSQLDLLQAGENILAIHGLNAAADDDEFVLRADLAEVTVDKGDLQYFSETTPLAFNPSSGVDGFLLDEIDFSQPHGFYEDPISLALDASTSGTTIRYTLDGSEPTERNGTTYSTPITIDSTATVRARAFKEGLDHSFVATATYVFLDDILEQSADGRPPDGFPTERNINGQTLNYGMDPEIVNDNVWGPQMIDALTQVPSMSIVMDIDDLLGSTDGIYTHPGSHGRAWERPASLELINPDGSEGFQVEMGIRIRGGFSRNGNNPKHAFRLFFREEYGDAKLEYPLFGDEGVDEFDKIDLRTTQNYSWAFQGHRDNAFVRDVFSRDMQRELGQPYTRSRYYHLYMNGQYWGLFQTQERAEARFAESYFGGDQDDYDVVKSTGNSGNYRNEATDGTLDAYQRLADYFYQPNGLSDANMDDYWRAQGMNSDGTRNPDYERLLDVDNLIDYMIITYYTGDRDGPVSRFVNGVNNYFGIYNREDPDGFKFFEHDSEHSLDKGFSDLALQITSNGSTFSRFNPLWMHEQLASDNTEYRLRFADAVYEYFENNGVMSDDNAQEMIDARAAEIDQAIIAESARWGDAKLSSPLNKSHWLGAVNRAKDFFNGRGDEVIGQFQSLGWYPTANPPIYHVEGNPQHGGDITSSDNIVLSTSTSTSFDETIVDRGSSWNYLDDGSNQGTGWRTNNYDDSSWSTGRAQLGYGDGDETTVVSYGPDGNSKRVTTYYRRTFNVSDASFEALKLRLQRDDGAIVYLNGEEIARSNMPGGNVGHQTTALSVVGGAAENTFFEFDLAPTLLRTGSNVLAVEIHQANLGSSDTSFDLELIGGRLNSSESNIYYTIDGSDPRLPNGEISPTAIQFNGRINLPASAIVTSRSREGTEWSVASVANFIVENNSTPGDLNADGLTDVSDIDLLVAEIIAGSTNEVFDLNDNGTVDDADLTYMVESILKTRRGDTDLDGDVDFNDFLNLAANFGNSNAGWSQGNFDLDNEVVFQDFLVLTGNFNFQAEADSFFGDDDEDEDEASEA